MASTWYPSGKVDYLLVFLLSLFFLNLYGTFQFVGIVLGGYLFVKYSKFVVAPDKNIYILLLFGVTYVVFSSFNIAFSARTIYAFVFLPLVVYLAGRSSNFQVGSENVLVKLLLVFSFSVAFIYLFSILESYVQYGVIGERVADLRFMSRTDAVMERTATGVAMHYTPLLGFLPVLLFAYFGKSKRAMVLGAVLTVLSAIASALIATRTPIGILALLLVFVFMFNLKNQSFVNKIVISLIAFVFVYATFYVDFEAIEVTAALHTRFQQDDVGEFGLRLKMWQAGVRNIFQYPWGGEFLQYNFYHNLWLDLRKFGGVVPMVFLLIFSVSSIRLLIAMLANNNISLQLRSLIGAMFLAVFAMMFMEPVIEGSKVFFLYYIFLVGFMKQVNSNLSSNYYHQNTHF